MDIKKLKELIGKAIEAGLKRPTPPPWMVNTESGQSLMRLVSTNDKSIEKEMLHFLNSEPSLEIFNAKMFRHGWGSTTHITHETLLQWLLHSASTSGIDKAVSDLDRYLKLDFTPAIEILAISGVDVDRPIYLTPSLTLVPFSELPQSIPKEVLDPPLLRPENLVSFGLTPFHYFALRPTSAAIVKSIKLSPKSFDEGADISAYIPQSLDFYEACESLTLIGRCTPLPIAHWCVIEDWVPCSGYLGAGWSSPSHDVINLSKCKISDDQAGEVRSLCDRFFKLTPEVREKLRVPIQRLNQARRRQNLADKAIDLGVSFESLYLSDRTHKEQIAFTFRLRGSWHLGKDKLERQVLIDIFNKVYECRSVAVHTGKLDYKIPVKGRGQVETSKFLEEADALCVRSITDIINSGKFPDWDNMILGTD